MMGMKKKGYMMGGMATPMMDQKKPVAKTMGYKKGGMVKANCGASMAPNRKAKK
jgi:hypothetical protein